MQSRRTSVYALALLALALPLAACGSDDSSGATDTTAPAGTQSPTDTEASSGTDATAGTEAPSDTTATSDAGGGSGEVPDGPDITIGAQDFGESAILAEIYGQALEGAGYPVSQQELGGFRQLVFTSFESGDINFTPEYAASALEFLNDSAGEASGDIAATVGLLQAQLDPLGLVAFEPSPAVDSNSFVVTAETAEELGLAKVSDLTDDLRLGGPSDCPDNASCLPGLISTYDLDLSANFTPLDGGGPLTVAALDGGEIDVAILFSTNSTIAEKGWVVLEDDRGLINADNITPIGAQALVDAYGEDMLALVDDISSKLTTAELTELNRRVEVDLEDADAVALDWLKSEGLAD
jgi:osmoprotectant transport system substrate-binding protein